MASMVAFAQSLSASFQRARNLFSLAALKTASPGAKTPSGHIVPPPAHFEDMATGFGYLVEGLKTTETQLSAMGDTIQKNFTTDGLLTAAGQDFRAAKTAVAGTGFFVNWNGPPASYYKSMGSGLQRLASALEAIDGQIKAVRPELERAVKTANTVPGYDPTYWQRNSAALNNQTFNVPTSVLAQKKF